MILTCNQENMIMINYSLSWSSLISSKTFLWHAPPFFFVASIHSHLTNLYIIYRYIEKMFRLMTPIFRFYKKWHLQNYIRKDCSTIYKKISIIRHSGYWYCYCYITQKFYFYYLTGPFYIFAFITCTLHKLWI